MSLPVEPPHLVRTTTVHGVHFIVPNDEICTEVDGVTVKVERSILATQSLQDIIGELPESIGAIVSNLLNR